MDRPSFIESLNCTELNKYFDEIMSIYDVGSTFKVEDLVKCNANSNNISFDISLPSQIEANKLKEDILNCEITNFATYKLNVLQDRNVLGITLINKVSG